MDPCIGGLVVAAVVVVVAVPSSYLVPHFLAPPLVPLEEAAAEEGGAALLPALDLLLTGALLAWITCVYIFDWIQRKLLERRIVKLNQELGASLARVRARDAQQEKLEREVKTVQEATAEYNLLLYLLLRQRRALASLAPPSCTSMTPTPT